MPETPTKFYLTTPIYYVNARPHIGHAYTTIVADVLARRARSQGTDTWFLTGTDEHGQKIERSAAAAGIPPQQFADQISKQFQDLWDRMGLTYDQFIRTTDEAHKRGVQKLFTTLQQNGHIYLSSYTGAYCVSDETFVDVPTGTPCPDCGRPTETVTEENYFFRLSAFQLPLLNLIESNQLQIEPDSRRNEVLSFLRGGLKDLSISRSSFTWGIPVPPPKVVIPDEVRNPRISSSSTPLQQPKEAHVIYVWLDALANYMTAVGYGDDSPEAKARFAKYWPADLHIVGKEIIRFHCVYWPAFLLAANLPLPKKIVAHGWLLFDDAKMSKSKGNIVRTETILEAFGTLCPPPPATAHTPGAPSFDSPTVKGWGIEPTARPSSLEAPPPSPASLKGTASAVPQTTPTENAALAAEVRSPSTPPQPPSPSTVVILDEVQNPRISPEVPIPSKHHRDLFAADVLRYFLLREIPFGQDGSFSFEALITRYNADLANGYGNLVKRTLTLVETNLAGLLAQSDPFETRFWEPDEFQRFWSEIAFGESKTAAGIQGKEINDAPTMWSVFERAKESIFIGCNADLGLLLGPLPSIVFSQIQVTDGYLSAKAPWKLAKQEGREARIELEKVLYTAAESIRIITALLHPILPYATASVWRQLGLGDIEQAARNGDLKNLQWGGLQPGTRLGPLSPIFPRADKGLAQLMANMESLPPITTQQDAATPLQSEFTEAPIASVAPEVGAPGSGAGPSAPALGSIPSFNPAAPPRTATLPPEPHPGTQVAASAALTTERPIIQPHNDAVFPTLANVPGAPSQAVSPPEVGSTAPDASPQITIEDFAKIELRVAQILVAERIPKADKLLRLEVDLGYEKRQILSGIAEWYTPEDLLGRRIVVITNLAPRKMRGLESHGMLLAASTDGGKPHLATIDSPDLPLGSRLK